MDVRANCVCASLLRTQIHATSWMGASTLSNKINNNRADGFAAVLPGLNDLGLSGSPTFLCRNRSYSQLSPHSSKMDKKTMWEVKKIQDFCPRDIESGHLGAARRVKNLVAKYELVL